MKYHIHITEKAKEDMVQAADCIEFTLLNPDAADDLLDAAETGINSLEKMPDRIRPVDDPFLSSLGIRFLMIKNYLAFYIIAENTKTVHIIRFIYNKRNWAHILQSDFSLE